MQRRTLLCASLGLGAAAAWPLLQPAAGKLVRGPAGPLQLHAAADLAFGTVVSIKVLHDDARQAELALADALAEGRIAGAGLDVYAEEPAALAAQRTELREALEQP